MNNLEELKEIAKLPSWRVNEALDRYITKLDQNEPNRGNFEPNNTQKQRTLSQNAALHLGLTFIAKHLNEIGKDMRVVLKPSVDILWSPESVKEYLFRPIMTAHTTKKSTTELTKQEVSEVWDILFKFLGEKHGIEYIPFPSNTVIDQTSDAYTAHRKLVNSEDYPENNLEPTF